MSDRKLRVAVLGQGRSGYDIHVRWIREDRERFQVVAVADLLPERHEAVQQLGAKGFTDYRELLADRSVKLDLVVNALPSHLHTAGTIAALNAGHNVLSEKPFALTLADFDAMTSAAKSAGRHLFAFQNGRFHPAFGKIQEILASGKLGRLVFARLQYAGFARRWDWQTSQRLGGGNLNNTGPHPLDQAIVLFGERMPKVFSHLACINPFGDADNFALLTLSGENAPLIEVVVSSFQAYPAGDMYNLSCEFGGVTGNGTSLKWRYFDPSKAPAHEPMPGWSDNRKYNKEELPWVEESWTAPASDVDNFQFISRALYSSVYDVLVNGAQPIVRLEQVRRQIAVLEQCHRQNPLPRKNHSRPLQPQPATA